MNRIVRVRAVIEHEGLFLFVRHKPDSSFWALPGGKVDVGESLETAMERELVEELGISPQIGKILYIQQLFMADHESLEFFFQIQNSKSYLSVDLDKTSHGASEIEQAAFIDPSSEYVLPEFLTELKQDLQRDEFPRLFVRQASRL